MVAAGHSVYQLVQLGNQTVWTGAAIATLPGALFFIYVFIARPARTSATLPLLWVFGGIGTLLVYLLEPVGSLPMFYALGLGLIGSLLYDFWFSRFRDRDKNTLAVGKELPDFDLYDINGNRVTAHVIRQSAALLMFYRGNWCPLCMAQIREVVAQYQELHKRGVKTFLISNQSAEKSAKLAAKFSAPMTFLIDKDLAAAQQLGLVAKGGTPAGILGYSSDTNLPTVIMTDSSGQIIFADLTDNYRVRPEPATFLKLLDSHQIAFEASPFE